MTTPAAVRRALLAAVLLAAPTLPTRAQSFSIVGLPDTQNYSELFPSIFYAQTQWVVDNLAALDIQYVAHYGDLVQHADDLGEWAVADTAMATLDASGIPYGATAGNHDITASGVSGQPYIPQNYADLFGPQRYAGSAWFGGSSPTGMSNYQVFSDGDVEFLGLHVEVDAAFRELEWAQGVLDRHRDKPVIFTTHRYLQDAEDYTAGVPVVPSGYYPEVWYAVEGVYAPGGLQTPLIFDYFVRRNPNVFLVNCGHFHEEFRQTSSNAYGRPVHEVLADFQDDPNGGDGWLRIMTLDLAGDHIDVQTYSPTLDQFRFADESLFSLPVDFEAYRESRPTVVLQQGINGYAGTQDTWINEDSPNTSYGDSDVRVSDDDTANSFFSDDQGQALLRFDGLIGPDAVPSGAQVVSATLTLQLADDIDNPLFDPDFLLYRCDVPWDESSTWNSLGNGLSGGELGPLLAVFSGDNSPNSDFMRRLDVTAAVQAWADGLPNRGFAILPEIISGNDDGIEILTSESGAALLRPRIEVVFEADCARFQSYGTAAGIANSLTLEGLGAPELGGTLEAVTSLVPGPGGVFWALSFGQADLPYKGGKLLVDLGQLISLVVLPSAAGQSSLTIPLPQNPNLDGVDVFLQSAAADPLQSQGLGLSNGLRATLCFPAN